MRKQDPYFSDSGMHRIYNVFAYNRLDRGIDIPDAALGIGFAEYLGNVPTRAYMPPIRPPELPKIKSIDDAYVKNSGQSLNIESFSMVGYYGQALGGW